MNTCKLPQWKSFLYNECILLRADLNVPLDENGAIRDDTRLQGITTTIDFLINAGAKIFLITHLGQPIDQEPSLSTSHLMPWFLQRGYNIQFAQTAQKASQMLTRAPKGAIVLLENLRFFKGEKDPLYADAFAQELIAYTKYFINDAWGSLHRLDTSLVKVASLFNAAYKTYGFLVENEIQHLMPIRTNPAKPFVVILGGGKGREKITYLKKLCLANPPTHLILLPGVSNTFQAALGKPLGLSPVNPEIFDTALEIIELCNRTKIEIIMPEDYLIGKGGWDGSLEYVNEQEFPENGYAISIGPKTVKLCNNIIIKAKTVFINGMMGNLTRPETCKELREMLRMISQSSAHSVIGGGDSIAALHTFGLANHGIYISTGGGSTLAYISHELLPGLEAVS